MFVFEIKSDKASALLCKNGYLDAFNMIKNKKGYEVYKDYPTICVYLGNDRRIYGVDAFKKLSDTIKGVRDVPGNIRAVRFFMLESWEYGHNIANVPKLAYLINFLRPKFNEVLATYLKSNSRNQMPLEEYIRRANYFLATSILLYMEDNETYREIKRNLAYFAYGKIERNIIKFDKINYVSYIGGHLGIRPAGYDSPDFDYKTYQMFNGKGLYRYTNEIADSVKKYIRANNSYKYMGYISGCR